MELTPKQVVRELDRYIIGQDEAKRAVAVALRNRYRRAQLPEEIRDEIVPKNILMVGPTGVGKTEIARRLAKLVDAPFVKVEATKFTEVGYVGRDVESIIRDLVEASVRICKEKASQKVKVRATVLAEERIIDLILHPNRKPVNPIDVLLGNKPKQPELPAEEKQRIAQKADELRAQLQRGELEDVEREDERSLFAHYNEILAHSRVEIFYMGRKTAADAAEAFREALKELPRGVCTAVGTSVVERAETVREKVETMDVAQGKLAIGLRTGCTAADEGYPALLMMNAIFGGGATSKLFTKVREEMSLCYYAGSSVEKFKGVMLVSSGIETANYETAKKEILNQLEQCRAGNISDYEFDSAKRYILSELKSAADSPGRLDDFYIGNAAAGLDGTLDALAKKIEGITKQEAAAAAKRLTLDTIYFLKGAEA